MWGCMPEFVRRVAPLVVSMFKWLTNRCDDLRIWYPYASKASVLHDQIPRGDDLIFIKDTHQERMAVLWCKRVITSYYCSQMGSSRIVCKQMSL